MSDRHSRNGFLCRKGLEEAAQRGLELPEGVDMGEPQLYLDKVGSVSAAERRETSCVWDDELIDSQYRRFLDAVA